MKFPKDLDPISAEKQAQYKLPLPRRIDRVQLFACLLLCIMAWDRVTDSECNIAESEMSVHSIG